MDFFELLLALVVANLPAGLVCSAVARRRWGHWLCLAVMAANALPLVLVLRGVLGMATGRYPWASLFVIPSLLLLVEVLWFLHLSGRYRRTPPPIR